MMPFIKTLVAGLFAAGALAVAPNAPYSNARSTETPAPQELGFTTMAGALVYSMNVCTIVHSTGCWVSLSTGGPAPVPVASSSSAAGPGPVRSGTTYPAPKPPAPTVLTTTDAAGVRTVITHPGAPASVSASRVDSADATGRTAVDASDAPDATRSSGASATASATGDVPASASATGVPTASGAAAGPVRLVDGVVLAALALAVAIAVL